MHERHSVDRPGGFAGHLRVRATEAAGVRPPCGRTSGHRAAAIAGRWGVQGSWEQVAQAEHGGFSWLGVPSSPAADSGLNRVDLFVQQAQHEQAKVVQGTVPMFPGNRIDGLKQPDILVAVPPNQLG